MYKETSNLQMKVFRFPMQPKFIMSHRLHVIALNKLSSRPISCYMSTFV